MGYKLDKPEETTWGTATAAGSLERLLQAIPHLWHPVPLKHRIAILRSKRIKQVRSRTRLLC